MKTTTAMTAASASPAKPETMSARSPSKSWRSPGCIRGSLPELPALAETEQLLAGLAGAGDADVRGPRRAADAAAAEAADDAVGQHQGGEEGRSCAEDRRCDEGF